MDFAMEAGAWGLWPFSRAPHTKGYHREVVVAPTTPRVTVRWRRIRAISPPRSGGRANEDDGSLRKKPWVSSLGGALLVLFSPRGEKSTPTPQETKENAGGSKPPPYGNGRTAAGSRKGTFAAPALRERKNGGGIPQRNLCRPRPTGTEERRRAEDVPFCPWRQKGTERAPPKGSRPLETYVTFMFLFDRTYTRRRFAIFAPQIPAETNIAKRRQTQPKADARP